MGYIHMPDPSPELGIPVGEKQEGQRVDFRDKKFDLLIETKGYLVLWERAIYCPCKPVATQTKQSDPNCPLCKGLGITYVGGTVSQDLSAYKLEDWQEDYVAKKDAMVIRGVIQNVYNRPDILNTIGRWMPGTSSISVRHGNRVGFYDRITAMDAEMAFYERLEADGSDNLDTRYVLLGVNYIRSIDRIYQPGDYYLDRGKFKWNPSVIPPKGTILSIHYLAPMTWQIIDQPHTIRASANLFKIDGPDRRTPTGNHTPLPLEALMQLDFLVEYND